MAVSNFSERKFFRFTPVNVAATVGRGAGATEDEIRQIQLRSGTITLNSTTTVALGSGTSNFGAVGTIVVGDIISYIDPVSSLYKLAGVVTSTTDNGTNITGITLAANATTSVSNAQWAIGGTYINPGESFLIRVQANLVNSGNSVQIPDLSTLRLPVSATATGNANNTAYLSLVYFSSKGNVNTNNTDIGTNVTAIMLPYSAFPLSTGSISQWFNNSSQFPLYVWFSFNPFGDTGDRLPEGTLFNLSVQESLPEVTMSARYNFVTNGTKGWLTEGDGGDNSITQGNS